ncbi:hypothetical protein L3Y34_011149 [Caenorhabditis briggsae]|uniref:Uncharacterized protein n=1 Tax=Caenorhabditis briggsae TaxID=6238 RepID=A0AAE8ZQN3_CAEBR|nr:hypothetical protein L3Y34_011149 [Caenorhabditis briggsae]
MDYGNKELIEKTNWTANKIGNWFVQRRLWNGPLKETENNKNMVLNCRLSIPMSWNRINWKTKMPGKLTTKKKTTWETKITKRPRMYHYLSLPQDIEIKAKNRLRILKKMMWKLIEKITTGSKIKMVNRSVLRSGKASASTEGTSSGGNLKRSRPASSSESEGEVQVVKRGPRISRRNDTSPQVTPRRSNLTRSRRANSSASESEDVVQIAKRHSGSCRKEATAAQGSSQVNSKNRRTFNYPESESEDELQVEKWFVHKRNRNPEMVKSRPGRRQRDLNKPSGFEDAMGKFFEKRQFLEEPDEALELESGGSWKRISNWLSKKRYTRLKALKKKRNFDVFLYIGKEENVDGISLVGYLEERSLALKVLKYYRTKEVYLDQKEVVLADHHDVDYLNEPELDYQIYENQSDKAVE